MDSTGARPNVSTSGGTIFTDPFQHREATYSMGLKQQSYTNSFQHREDLCMWRAAREYYLKQGWTNLADTAEKQIRRLLNELKQQDGSPRKEE